MLGCWVILGLGGRNGGPSGRRRGERGKRGRGGCVSVKFFANALFCSLIFLSSFFFRFFTFVIFEGEQEREGGCVQDD